MKKDAAFIPDNGHYLPANKNAIAACALMSKMKLKGEDMLAVRSLGYEPRLLNGDPIGRVDITV